MVTYIALINKLQQFANQHPQVKKFGSDFLEQLGNFATTDEKYPILFVVPINTIIQENVHIHIVDIYCLDIIKKDRVNINTSLSDTSLILSDVYHFINEGSDYSVFINNTPIIQPINNYLLDYTVGNVARFEFETSGYTDCQVPVYPETKFIIDEFNNIISDEFGNNFVWE